MLGLRGLELRVSDQWIIRLLDTEWIGTALIPVVWIRQKGRKRLIYLSLYKGRTFWQMIS